MATKQIHELPQVTTLNADDRIIVSTRAGNLTRQATLESIVARIPGTGAVERRIAGKLADFVSVKDFGAVGDGIADDAPAFALALAANRALHIPPGLYRRAAPIEGRP